MRDSWHKISLLVICIGLHDVTRVAREAGLLDVGLLVGEGLREYITDGGRVLENPLLKQA